MTPTAAARASQPASPSLRDRLRDASLLRDRCYIDGAWVGTPSRPVTNPVNGIELAKVPVMSTAETTQAVEAAERAFPAWAKLTAKQRSNILRKWFELIAANRDDLALILTSEQGKPLAEALGEVDIGGAYVEFGTFNTYDQSSLSGNIAQTGGGVYEKSLGDLSMFDSFVENNQATNGDGGGLYLQVSPGGRSWVFRYRAGNRERWMGLGPLRDVSLAEAREKASRARKLRLEGIDPLEARKLRQTAARLDVVRGRLEGKRAAAQLDKPTACDLVEEHIRCVSDAQTCTETMDCP